MLLPVVAGVIATLEVRPERMRAALDEAMLATDLADYLVKRGLPFREAHHVVGQAVLLAERAARWQRRGTARPDPGGLPVPLACFQADLFDVLSYEGSVEAPHRPGRHRARRGGAADRPGAGETGGDHNLGAPAA